jgi:hypothetical protein
MFSGSASQTRRCSDAAATVSSFGYGRWASGTVRLPYFSCVFLSGSVIGNLPKREARLLESETQPIFWLAAGVPADEAFDLRSVSPLGALAAQNNAQVPLDDAETKSEDHQMDVGRNAAQAPTTAIKTEVEVAST